MKVILNRDISPLGEEGDVKDVARGYARNYLLPRGYALPYTDGTVRLFEARRGEIEARKAAKRQDAAGIKEKLEALDVVITMPAGANGRLYGAVTNQLVSDELAKLGYPTERKRIELPGTNFKSVGKYKALIKLYESAAAEIAVTVQAQEMKTDAGRAGSRRGQRRDGEAPREEDAGTGAAARELPAEAGAAADAEGALPGTAALDNADGTDAAAEAGSAEDAQSRDE